MGNVAKRHESFVEFWQVADGERGAISVARKLRQLEERLPSTRRIHHPPIMASRSAAFPECQFK